MEFQKRSFEIFLNQNLRQRENRNEEKKVKTEKTTKQQLLYNQKTKVPGSIFRCQEDIAHHNQKIEKKGYSPTKPKSSKPRTIKAFNVAPPSSNEFYCWAFEGKMNKNVAYPNLIFQSIQYKKQLLWFWNKHEKALDQQISETKSQIRRLKSELTCSKLPEELRQVMDNFDFAPLGLLYPNSESSIRSFLLEWKRTPPSFFFEYLPRGRFKTVRINYKMQLKNNLKNNFDVFKNLYHFLKKLILNHKLSDRDLEQLSAQEQQILKWFLIKKGLLPASDEHEPLTTTCLKFRLPKYSKKIQEKQLKFILSLSFKFLKMHWKAQQSSFRVLDRHAGLNPKNQLDIAFYFSYFGQICRQYCVPLPVFFLPQLSFPRGKEVFLEEEMRLRSKSLSCLFLKRLGFCSMLKKNLQDFINEKFTLFTGEKTGIRSQFRDSIKWKLGKKLQVWSQMYRARGLQAIRADLLQNHKCKLPWFLVDVEFAIKIASKKLFD